MDWWTEFWAALIDFTAKSHLDTVFAVLGIIVGAFVVRWLLHFSINRTVHHIVSGVKKTQKVEDTQALTASPLAAVRLVQRTRTLGTVLRNIINVSLVVATIILALNVINPGVIGSLALVTAALGAALGIGGQNTVRDVVNGLFIVMEDQLGVGDVVDLGLATGVVEVVGIRSTQVRDDDGTLWFVRNGEILRVGNMSQGWARVIIDLAVPYDVDIEAIEEQMLRAATELAATPHWSSRVLEKPAIWGLESISGEALIIRLVIKTRTTAKDDIARELRARLKRALDEMGVRLPSLNSVVLSSLDDSGRLNTGSPRTSPAPIASTQPPPKRPKS